jgi:ribosomal protein S18 acetylase RimI-like enzyme
VTHVPQLPVGRIPRTPSLVIRPLIATDVDHILELQQLAYAGYYLESAESFAVKIAAGTETCFGAWFDGQLVGYLVAVPLRSDEPLDLNSTQLQPTPMSESQVLYIHDLAVHPERRKSGLGDVLLVNLYDSASRYGIEAYSLVAVQNSSDFWAQRGFTLHEGSPAIGYGPEAVRMSRR